MLILLQHLPYYLGVLLSLDSLLLKLLSLFLLELEPLLLANLDSPLEFLSIATRQYQPHLLHFLLTLFLRLANSLLILHAKLFCFLLFFYALLLHRQLPLLAFFFHLLPLLLQKFLLLAEVFLILQPLLLELSLFFFFLFVPLFLASFHLLLLQF